MQQDYRIRVLSGSETGAAAELMWEVFLQFEAPEYPQAGVQTFRAVLDDREKMQNMRFYGAFDGETLIGVLGVRAPQHIGFFFVQAAYHRQGIGRALFEAMAKDYPQPVFTVNSAPYAVAFYRRLGFLAAEPEQLRDGIRYTPMVYCAAEKQFDAAAVARVAEMEYRFGRVQAASEQLSAALAQYRAAQSDLAVLGQYYDAEWRTDFEADEAGAFPAALRRGVLSEDGLWNLLSDCKTLADDLRAQLSDMRDEV